MNTPNFTKTIQKGIGRMSEEEKASCETPLILENEMTFPTCKDYLLY